MPNKKKKTKKQKVRKTNPKKVSDSHSESSRAPVQMSELVLPSHTNNLNTIFGGVVMSWIDIAAAIAAQRYARRPCVTLSIDFLRFIKPIKTGYIVYLTAKVNWVGRTSMEIEVDVEAENPFTGDRNPTTKAYLTFVALDEDGKPSQIPSFEPKTKAEKLEFEEAKLRRERRFEWATVL